MKKVILTFCFTFQLFIAFAQDAKNQQKVVAEFINNIKSGDKEAIAKKIAFPFEREYPIPAVKNKAEFLKRYSEIFDDKLVKLIVNSSPAKDWHDAGWRGIVFQDGIIWMDIDGRLLEVNGDTEAEKKIKAHMLAQDKKAVHASLKDFKRPLYVLKTAKYLIRIDLLNNDTYRYASWKAGAKMTDKPELIITNGTVEQDGSGGNHSYKFKKGEYTYECAILTIGAEDTPPAMLTVLNGSKEILSQSATIVLK